MNGRGHKNHFHSDAGNAFSEPKRKFNPDHWFLPVMMTLTIFVLAALTVGITMWAAGGHLPKAVEATWPQIVVAEKIIKVNHHEESDGGKNPYDRQEEWTSVDTAQYHMLNNSFGMSRLCPALTNDVVAREAMYANEMLDQIVLPGFKENIVIPRPTPELDTAKCTGMTPAGDHFVYHGKTVAILTRTVS